MKIKLILMLMVLPVCVLADSAPVLPAAAVELKAKRDAKIAEINRVYAVELEKIQKKAMAAGNLTGANEIEKEIAAVVENPLDPMIGKWKWGTGGELDLQSNGSAVHSKWGGKGKWKKIKENQIQLESDSGIQFVVTFKGDTASVSSKNGGGTSLVRK
jgi:hypothetical protein